MVARVDPQKPRSQCEGSVGVVEACWPSATVNLDAPTEAYGRGLKNHQCSPCHIPNEAIAPDISNIFLKRLGNSLKMHI